MTPEKVEIARQADNIFISEIRKAGLYDQISQAYAAVDPSRAVGVMGDKRVYGYIVILRAVTTTDFMTAVYVTRAQRSERAAGEPLPQPSSNSRASKI